MRLITSLCRMTIAALVLCLMFTVACADTNDFTFALNSAGDGYVVTGYTGSDSTVTVPAWYNSLPVTEIGSGAFQGNAAIQTLSMPSTIVRIGTSAFKNCTNLSKLTYYAASDEPPTPARIPGDADNDGKVDEYDALLVMQYDAGWSVSVEKSNADVDASGAVDIEDAVLIFQYGAGEDVTLN